MQRPSVVLLDDEDGNGRRLRALRACGTYTHRLRGFLRVTFGSIGREFRWHVVPLPRRHLGPAYEASRPRSPVRSPSGHQAAIRSVNIRNAVSGSASTKTSGRTGGTWLTFAPFLMHSLPTRMP